MATFLVSSALPLSPGHAGASDGKTLDPAAQGNFDSPQSSPTSLGRYKAGEKSKVMSTNRNRTNRSHLLHIYNIFWGGEKKTDF